jgi:hypothetical protein
VRNETCRVQNSEIRVPVPKKLVQKVHRFWPLHSEN